MERMTLEFIIISVGQSGVNSKGVLKMFRHNAQTEERPTRFSYIIYNASCRKKNLTHDRNVGR
jgi:hypothetical protein